MTVLPRRSGPRGPYAAAQSGLVIEEVIVTAQKREQSMQDIPVSVTAINSETID